MNRVDNKRSQNTKRKMEEGYLKLLNENPDHMVTVAELCREIHVNRTTFYSHYTDIAELHMDLMEKNKMDIMAILSDKELGDSWMGIPKLCALLKYVKTQKSFYQACYSTGIMEESRVIDILIEKKMIITQEQRIATLYNRAGINAVLKDWLSRDCEESPETMARMLRQIIN